MATRPGRELYDGLGASRGRRAAQDLVGCPVERGGEVGGGTVGGFAGGDEKEWKGHGLPVLQDERAADGEESEIVARARSDEGLHLAPWTVEEEQRGILVQGGLPATADHLPVADVGPG